MVLKRGLGCDQNVRRHVSPVFENDWHIVLFDHVAGAKVIQS